MCMCMYICVYAYMCILYDMCMLCDEPATPGSQPDGGILGAHVASAVDAYHLGGWLAMAISACADNPGFTQGQALRASGR